MFLRMMVCTFWALLSVSFASVTLYPIYIYILICSHEKAEMWNWLRCCGGKLCLYLDLLCIFFMQKQPALSPLFFTHPWKPELSTQITRLPWPGALSAPRAAHWQESQWGTMVKGDIDFCLSTCRFLLSRLLPSNTNHNSRYSSWKIPLVLMLAITPWTFTLWVKRWPQLHCLVPAWLFCFPVFWSAPLLCQLAKYCAKFLSNNQNWKNEI